MQPRGKKGKPRGVVDTSVLVSGISGFRKPYVPGKNPSADFLYRWAEKTNYLWLVTEDVLDEYKEVLKRLGVRSNLIGTVVKISSGRELNTSMFADRCESLLTLKMIRSLPL